MSRMIKPKSLMMLRVITARKLLSTGKRLILADMLALVSKARVERRCIHMKLLLRVV